jgi:hypothetical protein
VSRSAEWRAMGLPRRGMVRRTREVRMLTLFLGAASLAACGGGRSAEDTIGSDPALRDTSADADTLAGASPVDTTGEGSQPTESRWGYPALAANEVPSAYLEEWAKAENRATCAPIAPAALGAGEGATPRAATFSGGWAVAYDLPDRRSAFGVAGAGSTTSGDIYSEWTNRRDWPDGSFAEYGPEGGQGPNQLAYLRVTGQDCLYNIWSRMGRAHLELLLDQLRRVTVPPA